MSEENTQNLTGGHSFEERVFVRFDALDGRLNRVETRLGNVESRLGNVESRLGDMDGRLGALEARSYDTKPIWERALQEIAETRRELTQTRREMARRLDKIEIAVLETRAGLGDMEDRVEKLESGSAK